MAYEWGIIIFLTVLCASVIFWMITISYTYRLDKQNVALDRLPASFDGTRLLFLSDVHRRVIPDEVIRRCKEAGGADLVLIGGDLREKGVPLERSRVNVKKLAQIGPVYMVYGNHDYDEDIREFDVMLREEGVRLLVNESVVMEQPDGSRIRLAGVDDPRTLRDRLPAALREPEGCSNLMTLLLAHDPVIAGRISQREAAEIDLILSGHTHGGQILLPIIGPLNRSPNIRRFMKGWFTLVKQTTSGGHSLRMFVSCGFGTSKMPLRFRAPAQYHLITLRCRVPVQDRLKPDR